MKDEIDSTPPVPASAVQVLDAGNVSVTASTPIEMEDCQQALIAWAIKKVEATQMEADELRQAFEHAVKQKWKSATLKRHADKAQKRAEFFLKVKLALEHGYHIVPNFPVQVIAVRTKKKKTKGYGYYSYRPDFKQHSQQLEPEEGEFKNPFPMVRQELEEDQDGKKFAFADGWDDFEFPVAMAKPQIMKAATRAMALKFFDELGVLPHARKEDPILIGTVLLKHGPYYIRKRISFLIAWHLDTRML